MLKHYLRGRTLERCLAGHHLPERHTEGIKIRTNVHAASGELLGTGKLGVPAKPPGVEIAACEADSFIVAFAKPRSIIFAVLQAPSITLTMMLVGLMSRCTRLCSCTAARPAATCVVISSASFTSSRLERLMRFSSVSPSTNSIA